MSKSSSSRDAWRQALNLVFALTQIIAGYLPILFNFGHNIAASSAASQTPVIPAGYAFSIWGFIFFFALIYALYQARPSERSNALFRRLGWYTAGAFFFNTVWELVAQFISFGYPTFFVIVLILVFALGALFHLPVFKSLSLKDKWLVYLPVSVSAGWISAAVFANLSSVLNQLAFTNFGLSLSVFSSALILLAGLFASFILYKAKGNFLYGLTIVWALVAILVANLTRGYDPNNAILAGILTLIILGETYFLNL